MTLSKVDSYGISGSSGFEDADIVGNYAKRGIYNVDDVVLLNGATTACQYLATSEVFVELKNKLLSYDADATANSIESATTRTEADTIKCHI